MVVSPVTLTNKPFAGGSLGVTFTVTNPTQFPTKDLVVTLSLPTNNGSTVISVVSSSPKYVPTEGGKAASLV